MRYPINMITFDNITPRELEILYWITEGLSNKEIGEVLHISYHTVNAHVESLFKKTNSPNRVTLAVQAVKKGILHNFNNTL